MIGQLHHNLQTRGDLSLMTKAKLESLEEISIDISVGKE